DGWREIAAFSDRQAAEMIRADRIDILFDLGLHTAGNRLLIFPEKPAPIQVTYLGYCRTTGLEAMDCRISDWHIDPAEADLTCYTEQTLRLPRTILCYQPDGPTPEVSPLPADSTGCVTFSSRNNFAKLSPPVLEAWSEILGKVPKSRLILHAPEGAARQRTLDIFQQRGIESARLQFVENNESWADFIRAYQQVDIALDPFPYSGWITTCAAL